MNDVAIALEQARVLMARQQFDAAEREYERAVARSPTNPALHFGLAKLRYMRGDPRFARDLAAVAARRRDDFDLQRQFAEVLRLTGDFAGAELLLRDLFVRQGPLPELRAALATVLHEMGRLEEAEAEIGTAVQGRPEDAHMIETLIAVRLSMGRAEDSMPLIRVQRSRTPRDAIWIAHEATAARLMGHAAYPHLYDYDRLVRIYDLEPPPGWSSIEELNVALASALGARHQLTRPPFDQSMRSGTQTIGNLREDPDPAVRAIFAAFAEPIAEYRAALGDAPDHPLSAANRGPARLGGCWSVQLRQHGFHVSHIHPEGWLSSAYYVSVPAEVSDEERQPGWLKFGEPRFPVPGAEPHLILQPKPGRLVLFPSYMWHGTMAIHDLEPRLTIAFDVVTGR